MSVLDTAKQRVEDARERWPLLDHLVRTLQHYTQVNGSALAAAVTYFAFLSFFPLLALSFAVIGFVSKAYPRADDDLVAAIEGILPTIVGGRDGLDLATFQQNAPGILSAGLLLALYSGLGWLSGMRTALIAVFEEPEKEQPNFFVGKVRDLLALLCLGSVLIGSVAVSGVATKLTTPILELLGLGAGADPLLWVLAVALGLAASTVLFFAFFKLLATPNVPTRALWSGAALGAVVFELLKQLSTVLLQATKEQPAVQAFGIALVLVVWINYFSRVVVVSAAWAHTAPVSRAWRAAHPTEGQPVQGPQVDLGGLVAASPQLASPAAAVAPRAAFAAGAAAMLGLVAVVRRRTPPPAHRRKS